MALQLLAPEGLGMAKPGQRRTSGLRTRRPAAAKADQPHFIQEWRIDRGLTQEELAEATGLSGSSISSYENFTVFPGEKALKALAEALKVTRGQLLDSPPKVAKAAIDPVVEAMIGATAREGELIADLIRMWRRRD